MGRSWSTRGGHGRPILGVLLAACAPTPGPRTHSDDTDDTAPACPIGELLDGTACVPEACGTGPWGNVPVDADTVYADAEADPGGDGTSSAPFDTLQAGADAVAARGGGTLALAAGTFRENVVLDFDHDGLVLAGRCAALVVVDGSREELATLRVERGGRGTDVTASGLTLTGGKVGLDVYGSDLTLRDVRIAANLLAGVYAYQSATVSLTDVEVTGTIHARGQGARGLDLERGTTLTGERLIVAGNEGIGVYAKDDGTIVTLTDSVIRDTVASPSGTDGYGVDVEPGAALFGTGLQVVGNQNVGVFAQGTDADTPGMVRLVDSEVRDTVPVEDEPGGTGIQVGPYATLEGDGLVVAGSRGAGILAGGEGTAVHLTGSSVEGTVPVPDGSEGRGVSVQGGAAFEAVDVSVDGNAEVGIFAGDAGSSVTLVDVDVTGTRSSPDGTFGRGVYAQGGSEVRIDGGRVDGNGEVGVAASDPGTDLRLHGVTVTATRRAAAFNVALGVVAQSGAHVRAGAVTVEGTEGPGLYAAGEGTLSCGGCTLRDNGFAGALAAGGTLLLDRVTITDTRPDESLGGGIGVYATGDWGTSTLRLAGSVVGPHPYAAVWLDGDGSYTVRGDDLSGSPGILLGTWPAHGNAIFARGVHAAGTGVSAPGGTVRGLAAAGNTFHDASAVAVLLHDATATFSDDTWAGNGEDLRQQHCDAVAPVDPAGLGGATTVTVCPASDVLYDASLAFPGLLLPDVGTAG